MPISSFKEKIANEIGVPVSQQRLIFRGKVLKDEHVLSEYRILQIVAFIFGQAHDLDVSNFEMICALCTFGIFSLLNILISLVLKNFDCVAKGNATG